MRKFLAVATASTVALSCATTALADDNTTTINPPSGYKYHGDITQGEGSSQEVFKLYQKPDKDGDLAQQIVYDKDGKVVCDTASSKADFMWTAGNTRCNYKKPLDVIKDISSYIAAISAAIGALFAIYTTAQKFIK
ncbi:MULTISPECIES: hypothetical protein [Corynebacterium]|uniref:Uncharacterized protein n=2 Tax=Corynebacterium glucuronolyticum TaxID=39791 RepID=A0AAX1L5S5_9CORY|nr:MULTISPECIES: hypothetical protein [Corynebacterium]EEI63010.1 hypothetical protein HMPREF0293_1528 [Corynebacterium glucuronolyticum ATCC 51866]MCT1562545.1 hypothetical protein [Corynebacterium glucuronolyticum]OFO48214.1 hypothetical protein HMPREF3044_00415 [Corynebacterium sp. HMSC073D01]QRP69605.1 hypothetical protein I6J21_07110 [Corynebacterium glucuronolyticum]